MPKSRRTSWLWLVRAAGLLPAVWLIVNLLRSAYFIDPISALLVRTGRVALISLFLSLACTPLSFVLGFRRLMLARRPLGLYALAYAVGHVGIFVGWDYGLDFSLLWQAIAYQPFVVVGAVGFVILVGLGVTSISAVRRRMGRWWRPFQRSVYGAGILIVLHVMWQAKKPWEAWREVVILVVLLVIRLPWVRRRVVEVRKALAGSGSGE
jgi:methionine sulfoxide reductase heme-binding subunit